MSYAKELEATAKALVAPGKGILAADESTGTIKKRFDKIKVENTEDNRRDYREMLFTTKGCEEFVSGVILFDETLRQKASDGTPLAQILGSKGIIPGIKVDAVVVCPRGAHVRRFTGCKRKPDSSIKTMLAPLRQAFF